MLKWSPEPFVPDEVPAPALPVVPNEARVFEGSSGVVDSEAPSATSSASQFRSESGFADTEALLASMTTDERTLVFELVEMDVAAEYEAREQELRKEHEENLASSRADFDRKFSDWTESFADEIQKELETTAESSARLALALAGKIIRAQVRIEPGFLTRALEKTLFKVQAEEQLTVVASPEDAAWLEGHPEDRTRLRIQNVLSDPRIEPGGCLVRTENREWDATIGRQLESLGELVEEMISTGTTPPNLNQDPDDASGVD